MNATILASQSHTKPLTDAQARAANGNAAVIFEGLAGQSFAPGKGAGAFMRGRSARDGFPNVWPFRARNRRAHRLAFLLARQHPEWRLEDPALGPDALDLALLLAALVALELLALTCF